MTDRPAVQGCPRLHGRRHGWAFLPGRGPGRRRAGALARAAHRLRGGHPRHRGQAAPGQRLAAPAPGRGGLPGPFAPGRAPILLEAVAGPAQAAGTLESASVPAAVVATGGYGSGPAVLAAKALGIPYFLHESNAEPGVLVKRLSRGAARVWCGMEAVRSPAAGPALSGGGNAHPCGFPAGLRHRPRAWSRPTGSWCWGAAEVPGP